MAKHPAAPAPPSGQAPAQDGSGFNGELRCASLADLVQLECMSGAREAVLVTSNGRTGHLFFEGGAMVHARTATRVGREAALEILAWSTGTFSGSGLPWPEQHTIDVPWQQLLMEAAQLSDERGRSAERQPTSGTTAGDPQRTAAGSMPATSEPRVQRSSSMPARERSRSGSMPVLRKPSLPPPPRNQSSRASSMAGAVGAVRLAVRISLDGEVLGERGDAKALAELAPLLVQRLRALGAALGMAEFRSFDCMLKGRQLMVYRDSPQSYIALEAAQDADLGSVRAALKH